MYTRWKNFKLFIRNFIKGKSTFNSEINYKGVDDTVFVKVVVTIFVLSSLLHVYLFFRVQAHWPSRFTVPDWT